MIILGIDPGYERLGIAVIEKRDKKKEVLLYSDCFKTSSKIPFEERLLLIGQEIERIIEKFQPDGLSIENLFLSSNQKTAMHVAEVRGAILYIASTHDISIKEFTPLQIKLAAGGHGKSDKRSMMKMLPLLVVITKKIVHDDEFDAIATALTHFAYHH